MPATTKWGQPYTKQTPTAQQKPSYSCLVPSIYTRKTIPRRRGNDFQWYGPFKTLRPYLKEVTFIALTDHNAVHWLTEITERSGRLMRSRLRLSRFHFQIQNKKENKHSQADALSRLHSLGEAASPIEGEMPVFTSGGPPDEGDTAEKLCLVTETITTDDLLTTNLATKLPVLTPITSTELRTKIGCGMSRRVCSSNCGGCTVVCSRC